MTRKPTDPLPDHFGTDDWEDMDAGSMTPISDERLAEIEAALGEDTFAGITRTFEIKVPELRAIIQSLRARGGVRVKPLEWEDCTDGDMGHLVDTVIGRYTIEQDRLASKSFQLCLETVRCGSEEILTLREGLISIEAAKAAAQADYERRILPSLEASPAPVNEHPDDVAVDRFAAAMKAKLAKKREEGRGGWDDKSECSAEFLSKLLREHVEKGDPLDVGNLAMMLHQRGDAIAPASVSEEMVDALRPISGLPDWVGGFLNRRTDVEIALRAPLTAIKKGQPTPPPLTPESLWALADRLSIPEEFKPAALAAKGGQ